MRSHLMLALLSLGLLSCASSEENQNNLSIACAMKKCICEEKDKPVFSSPERRDVLWQTNGDAYCPQGFTLAEYVDKQKRKPGGVVLPRYTEPYPCNDTSARCKNQENMAE